MAAKPALAQLVMGEAVSVEPAVVERYRKLLIPALEDLWGEGQRPRRCAHRSPARLRPRPGPDLQPDPRRRHRPLPELLPEIVYLAILPFAGHDEALKQARLARDDAAASAGD